MDECKPLVSGVYCSSPHLRDVTRLMLGTVGKGGDGGQGQQIRDEILNIMHRNDIKEVSGTFIEEWHQKLHNNTTPDDIVICEAFLAFTRADGDVGEYWRVLGKAVQVDPIKPTLKAPGTERLKLEHDEMPSNFALSLSLRRYSWTRAASRATASSPSSAPSARCGPPGIGRFRYIACVNCPY